MKFISYFIYSILGLFVFAACSSSKTAYTVTPVSKSENSGKESNIIYALPKTILKIDVLLVQQEKTKGIYSEFASKLLNINDITPINQTTYSVVFAGVTAYSEADPDQYYFVNLNKSPIGVDVSPSGILHSVNFLDKNKSTDIHKNSEPTGFETCKKSKKFSYTNTTQLKKNAFIDFPKEGKISHTSTEETSLRKQAEDAANYINLMRQKKLGLLSGDYDDQYSAHAIEFMYAKLDSIEKSYVELFTGSVHVNYISESYTFDPQKSQLSNNEITATLFKYSETEGILPSQEDSGIPFQIRIKPKNKLSTLNKYINSSSNNQEKENGFYYRIPEEAIVILTAGHLQKEETILISQLGTVMNLPKLPFNALFDPKTGNVLKYNVIAKP